MSYQANPDVKNLLSYDISIDLKRACTLEPDPLFLSGTLRHYVKKRELASLLVNRKETSHPSWGQSACQLPDMSVKPSVLVFYGYYNQLPQT